MNSVDSMSKFTCKGVTFWIGLIKKAYYLNTLNQNDHWVSRSKTYIIKEFEKSASFPYEEVLAFYEWVTTEEGQTWFAQKSPSNAAGVAIRNRFRLCPAAEKYIVEKAKDRGALLEYCMTFGILLQNASNVTLKAAFGDNARHEKRYIKFVEETKKKVKSFLCQLVDMGQISADQTVKDLMETL